MKDNCFDAQTEAAIRAAMKLTDKPGPELNQKLKTALYQQEAAMQNQPAMHTLSVWYLPMILNLAVFLMLSAASLMVINSIYLSYFAAGICLYIGLAGVLLTIAGVRRAGLKKEITIRVKKRGVLA